MYIYKNEKKFKKNKLMSQVLTGVSFGVLIIGAILAFSEQYFMYSFIALLTGVIISQLSITLTTNWGWESSNDFIFNVKLKGLSDNFSIYHYMEPVKCAYGAGRYGLPGRLPVRYDDRGERAYRAAEIGRAHV